MSGWLTAPKVIQLLWGEKKTIVNKNKVLRIQVFDGYAKKKNKYNAAEQQNLKRTRAKGK